MLRPKKDKRMLAPIRWIGFLPCAFVASVAAGYLGFATVHLLGGALWCAWAVSGLFSGFAFINIGLIVAPSTTDMVKWTLVILVSFLGLASALGALLVSAERSQAWAGLVMVIVAVFFVRLPLDGPRRTMRNLLSSVGTFVFAVYFLGFGVSALYFNWDYARQNGFLPWLFLGEVVATGKALAWPYFSSISAAHDRAVEATRTPTDFHFKTEEEVSEFFRRLVVEWNKAAKNEEGECQELEPGNFCVEQFKIQYIPSTKTLIRHKRFTSDLPEEQREAIREIFSGSEVDLEEICSSPLLSVMREFNVKIEFRYYGSDFTYLVGHSVEAQMCPDLAEQRDLARAAIMSLIQANALQAEFSGRRPSQSETEEFHSLLEAVVVNGSAVDRSFLRAIDADLPGHFFSELLEGASTYLEGLIDDNLSQQIEGIKLLKEWEEFEQKHQDLLFEAIVKEGASP